MKKDIEFRAKFDTSDFDKSVESMQKKLKDLYAPADMIRAQTLTNQRMQANGMGGMMSQPGGDAYSKATQQSRRELDQLIKEQATGQEKLGKMLAQRVDKLKEMKQHQADMVKGSREELELKEKIARVEENTGRLRENYKQRDASLNQMLDTREKSSPQGMDRIMNAYNNGGIGGAGRAGMRMMSQSPGGMMGFAGGAFGAIGSALQVGGALYRDYSRIPVDTAQATGNAVSGTVGKDLQNVYSGRTAFESAMFGTERQRAMAKAQEAYKGGRVADMMGVGGMAATGIGAGLGMMAGGPLGGAIAGGAVGLGIGAYNMITNQRSRDAFLGMFSDKYQGRYQAGRAEDFAKDFRATEESERDKNPVKKLAAAEFEKNMMRNLGAQRAMGLTNEQFTGDNGYLKRTTDAGFTHEMGIGMSSEIMGAGGSARMGREGQFGLQMQRMGMTNAGGILGSLSGSIQAPEANKRATISIMSEAFKIGLDNSEFSEETRRFTQATADIVAKSGATKEGDVDRISAMMGQFMGERTNQGVKSAGNAYEAFQSRSSELGGRRGVLRMSEAMSDPLLKQLGQQDLTALMEMRPDEMNESNPKMAYFAQKTGGTVASVRDAITKANRNARYLLPGQRKEVEGSAAKITEYMKQNKMTKSQMDEAAKSGKLPADIMAEYGHLEVAQGRTDQKLGQSDEMARTGEELTSFGEEEKPMGKTIKDSIQAMLGGTPRREDKFIQGAAGDAEVVRKNFNEMSGEMDKAAEAAAKMTIAARQMAIEFSNALERAEKDKKTGPLEDLLKSFQGPQNQQQGGKSSK